MLCGTQAHAVESGKARMAVSTPELRQVLLRTPAARWRGRQRAHRRDRGFGSCNDLRMIHDGVRVDVCSLRRSALPSGIAPFSSPPPRLPAGLGDGRDLGAREAHTFKSLLYPRSNGPMAHLDCGVRVGGREAVEHLPAAKHAFLLFSVRACQ